MLRRALTATDLFAGGGGSSLGLTQAGFDVVMAANHWPTAMATHKANHPHARHEVVNLRETDFFAFPSTRIMWASSSCVGHTNARGRKKLTADEERKQRDPGAIDRATALAVIEAADVHRYDAVVMENVPEFRSWVLFDWLIEGMQRLGYVYQSAVLNSAVVGPDPVSQNRKRWYGVFTADGNVDLEFAPSAVTPATTILDADPGKPVTRRLYVSPQIEQITERDVPHLVMYRRNARALRADEHPLATVTAGGNHHAVATIDHDGRAWHRLVNNRERARAQGFPDSYVFHGSPDDVRKQIGNAVPVNVARAIGGRLVRALGEAA